MRRTISSITANKGLLLAIQVTLLDLSVSASNWTQTIPLAGSFSVGDLFHLAAGIAAFGVLNTLVEALFHTYLQRTNANLKARLAKLEALQAKMAALSQSSPDLAVALGIIREELGDQDAASGRRAWIQNGIFYALGVVTPIILNFLSHHVSIR